MASTLSVVIPTYGRQELLGRAIASVLAAAPHAEVIVVDDATPEPVKVPSGVRLVRLEQNGGVAQARNVGVEHAEGHIIGFLDSDDFWDPARIERTLPLHDRYPIVLCWAAYDDELTSRGRLLHGDVSRTVLCGMSPHVGTTTLAREVWVPFDTSYRTCQDVEWWSRLAARGEVTTVPEVLCRIGRHPGERHMSGTDQRIADSLRLLDTPYFRSNRRATAFRLKRIGLMARQLGQPSLARRSFARSLVRTPSTRTALHLVRSLRPGRSPGSGQ